MKSVVPTSFHMAFQSNDPNYLAIANRLNACTGIAIADYIRQFDDAPFNIPVGFNFIGTNTAMLEARLRQSSAFGRTRFPDVKRRMNSFREINPRDSLHIHIAADGYRSIVHIDTVSIAKRRMRDGTVEYAQSASRLLQHVCVDYWHVKVPERDWITLPGGRENRSDGFF
jgi:hypothetical protein